MREAKRSHTGGMTRLCDKAGRKNNRRDCPMFSWRSNIINGQKTESGINKMGMNYYEYAEGAPVSARTRRTRRRKSRKNRLRALTVLTVLAAIIAVTVLIAGGTIGLPHLLPDYSSELFPQASSEADPASGATWQATGDIDKDDYTTVRKTKEDIHTGGLILVNDQHAYAFPDNATPVSVYAHKNKAYKVKDHDLALNENVISAMNKMMAAFYDRYGDDSVNIISGYRTTDYQQGLLDDKVREAGEEEALKWVARPGYSEHHTGLAFDLGLYNNAGVSAGFTGTGTFKWLKDNFYRYGFIVRYPEDKTEITGISFEPWHIRYVGAPHALIMKQNDFCFEEYIDFIQDFEFSKHHLIITAGNTKYEIYYTKSLKVAVPKEGKYTISGDNVDGFIVTIKR
jgi:D-alanyl-D-alanine carboxypeptidase